LKDNRMLWTRRGNGGVVLIVLLASSLVYDV
jgi:hypothetical protein